MEFTRCSSYQYNGVLELHHPNLLVNRLNTPIETPLAQIPAHLKEGNVLFNDALNTFYLRLYGVIPLRKREMKPAAGHRGYSIRLGARVLLYASSHRQDNTYHSLCYTSRGALDGTRNSSMGPPHEGSIRRPMSEFSYHGATSRSRTPEVLQCLSHV